MLKPIYTPVFAAVLLLMGGTAFAQDGTAAETRPETAKKEGKGWFGWWNKQDEDAPEKELQPKYPVEVVADNSEMKALLEQHLPLISYQRKEELDKEQIEFLLEDAPKDVQTIVRTRGYFNSKSTIVPQGQGYRLEVQLGAQTKINDVSVALLGDIMQDENLSRYYKDATRGWALPVGNAFVQEDWTNSKVSVLAAVTRKKYPLAKLTDSSAVVDPNKRQADLSVAVESDRPIYFGDFQISGTGRYPVDLVRGLAKFRSGDPYDLDKLLDYQQALENDNHYSGASVQADFDNLQGDRVPVKVEVSEVKRQKFDVGLRFDSEYGFGGSMGYDHYNLFGRGYVGSVFVEADRYQTNLRFGVSQPRRSDGSYLTTNLGYTRSTTQKLEKRTLSTGAWYVKEDKNLESRYGVELIGEDATVPDSRTKLGRSHALMLTAAWRKQQIESVLRPANGYYFDAKIGTTLGKTLSSGMLVRAKAGAGYYFTPEERKWGTLVLRGNVGYVYTREQTEVPSSLLFRTGGATSVRGYELDSIGRADEFSKAVLPDRAMAVASLEYQLPVKQDFALALFHDVGGTAATFQGINLRHGSGLGLRWFSPIAPFSFDLAYGHQDKKVRWHISLGTRF